MMLEIDFTRMVATPFPYGFRDSELVFYFKGYIANKDANSTSFIAKHWKNFGARFNQFITGAYSLIVLNTNTLEVWATQDSLGIGQVFISLKNKRLYIDSTLSSFQSEDFIFNTDYLYDWLACGSTVSQHTPVENVRRLRNGECIYIKNNQLHLVHKWTPNSYEAQIDESIGDAAERLRLEVLDAHSRHTSSSGSLIYELSGGLDSSTLVSLAAEGGRSVKTLTWVVDDPKVDEDYKYAKILETYFNLESIYIDTHTSSKIFEPDLIESFPEPGFEFAPEHKRLLNEALTQTNSRTVVSGVGGDNLFGAFGPPSYWLSDRLLKKGISEFSDLVSNSRDTAPSFRSMLKTFFSLCVQPLYKLHNQKPDYDFLKKILTRNSYDALRSLPLTTQHQTGSIWERYYWDQISKVVGNRASINFMSIEDIRFPFLDPTLLSIGASLQSLHNKSIYPDRDLQRIAFRSSVPEPILKRKTKGSSLKSEIEYFAYSIAFNKLLDGNNSILIDINIVNPAAWTEMMNRARLGYFENLKVFDTLIKTELWLQSKRSFILN